MKLEHSVTTELISEPWIADQATDPKCLASESESPSLVGCFKFVSGTPNITGSVTLKAKPKAVFLLGFVSIT